MQVDWKDAEAIAGLRYSNLSDLYFGMAYVYLGSEEALEAWLVAGLITNGIIQALIKKPHKGA